MSRSELRRQAEQREDDRGEDMTDWGMLIRRKRRAMELSQRELAKKSGVAERTVVRIEKGENMTTDSLMGVLDALDLRLQVVRKK